MISTEFFCQFLKNFVPKSQLNKMGPDEAEISPKFLLCKSRELKIGGKPSKLDSNLSS